MHFIALFLLLLSPTAFAGDPCPIPFTVYEHTPAWRDKATDLASLQSQDGIMGLHYRQLKVTKVNAGEPADAAGVQVGDIISAVNGQDVRDHAHASQLLGQPNRDVSLTIQRGGTTHTLSIQKKAADPVVMHMLRVVQALSTPKDPADTRCLEVSRDQLTPAQTALVAKAAFNASKNFQCSDAHTRLSQADFSYGGPLILVRGGSRLLLTVPEWGTQCVSVSEYDGAKLTYPRVLDLINDVGAKYIADRHRNP